MRHLIIGGDSMIGAALAAAAEGETVVTTTRRVDEAGGGRLHLNLAASATDRLPPADVVYLVAGIARLRQCREDPEGSRRINVTAIETLARHYAARGAFVIFLSTDKVFDGSRPLFLPTDPVCPVSVYGRQKADAEQAVLLQGPNCAVIRLSKVVQPKDALFSAWVAALRSGQPIRAFADLFFAPIALPTVISGIRAIATRRAGGIWHLSGKEDVDYTAAGRHIAELLGVPTTLIEPASAESVGMLPEERPRYTALDSRRTEAEIGLRIGDPWAEFDRGLAFG